MNDFDIQEKVILEKLREDWIKRLIRASLKGFWSISFVLVFNMFFIWWYLNLRGTPLSWAYFFSLYVLILPLGMLAFGKVLIEPYPTIKRYRLMLKETKLRTQLSNDSSIYFE